MDIRSTSNTGGYGRVTGLATGFDTDGMVKQMLARDRAKVDKVRQDQQLIRWRQEAYVDITKDLREFQDFFKSTGDKSLMTSQNYSAFKATCIDSTGRDTFKMSATAYGGAQKGVYNVKINQIAKGAQAQTAELKLSTGERAKLDSKLSEVFDPSNFGDGMLKITVGGKIFEVPAKPDDTLETFIGKIKDAKGTDQTGKVVDVNLGSLVDVNFSQLTGKFTLTSKQTGQAETMKLEGGISNLLGIAGDRVGQDASLSITPPGETTAYDVTSKTNDVLVDNVKFSIMDAKPNDEVTVNVTTDTTENVKKFKEFVEKYNKLIDKINSKISEQRQYKYKPLTEEQRKEMKPEEIKDWEEKAKQGIIKSDGPLQNLLLNLRETFSQKVKDAGLTPHEIGIDTSKSYRDRGKLVFDEDKFKSALENRGDQVQKLFTQTESVKDPITGKVIESEGIFLKMDSLIKGASGRDGFLVKKAGYTDSSFMVSNELTKLINAKDKLIKEMEVKIFSKQEALYRKFAALEKNMNSLNSQSNWLAQNMGQ